MQQAKRAQTMDHIDVGIHVGGRKLAHAPIAEWRFEGYINPEAYIRGPGGLIAMLGSPWSETAEDVWAAIKLLRRNRSRARQVVGRKQLRFRTGHAWNRTRQPHGYFRSIALDIMPVVRQLEELGVALSGSFINLGAGDGVGDDPLHTFARERQGAGPMLAVEAEPAQCERHRSNLPWVQLTCTKVTPQNVKALVWSSFPTHAARDALDVLKLDLDSFEAFVLEECLWRAGLSPKLLLVEVNVGIPPPLEFALLASPQLATSYPKVQLSADLGEKTHFFEVNKPVAGVSLSYLTRRLAPHFRLLELGSPDAIFVRDDVLQALGQEPLDEFQAFEFSWVDVHGFSRQQVRRWHFDVDEVTALGEVHEYLVDWMQRHLSVSLPFVLSY